MKRPSDATTRREFLQLSGLVAAGLALPGCAARPNNGDAPSPSAPPLGPTPSTCGETPDNILGPFFREGAPTRNDLNPLNEAGTKLTVEGRIFTDDCETPIPGARMDVWQADDAGDYDLDSVEYRFRALVEAGEDGSYRYTTVVPGRYLNGATYRPAHIHLRLNEAGHEELITQLYLEGDPFLESDPWALPELTRPAVDDGNGGLILRFDLVLATRA
jgi:catechol 1,2-dioxygenase